MRLAIIPVLLLALFQVGFAQTGESLAANPRLADYAQFDAAQTLFAAGQFTAALPAYQKVQSEYPQSLLISRAALMSGKCYLNLKNYPKAIKALATASDLPEARLLIGRAYEGQKRWQDAYLAYEETDLNSPLTTFGQRARTAIARLKKTHRKKLPKFSASAKALFKQGLSYFDDGDFETASNIFNRLARQYPKSKYVDEAWLMLGRAEMQTGNPEAIPDLERASQTSGRANYYLGFAYGRRGDYKRAIAALGRVDSADAAYWAAYFREASGDLNGALHSYYNLINKYPDSQAVSAAAWRIGKVYYWNSDFKNAAVYLHIAELYPPGEDSPRCYYFEAKAEEHLGNKTAALSIYEKLAQRFDHSYYAYRAKEKLSTAGRTLAESNPFNGEEFSSALDEIETEGQDELAAVMEIWEQANAELLEGEGSDEVRLHLEKYKELMALGRADYAADEARFLVGIASDTEIESAQTKLGEMLIRAGNFKTPIRFADRRVKAAVIAGKPETVSKKIWHLAYPKGYWQSVANGAKLYRLDPYLVLAVIREESRFNPRAVSHSRARGLMQIMPKTGRAIAGDLDLHRYRTSKLYTPATNINMGTYYLSNLIKSFGNNIYLALAGYNGGPNKIKRYVKSWYNDNLGTVDIDEFVESLPNRETRLYVQKVMGSYFEYKRLYERKRG